MSTIFYAIYHLVKVMSPLALLALTFDVAVPQISILFLICGLYLHWHLGYCDNQIVATQFAVQLPKSKGECNNYWQFHCHFV